jgi:cytochrome c oxidase subunit 3
MTAARALPAPPELRRPRRTSVAAALVGLGSAMVFAALIGIYLQLRVEFLESGGEWLGSANIPLTPPNVMMATLAMSVVTMQWAHYAIARNDRVNAYVALGLTLVFGVAFINSQAFMYSIMELGIRDGVPELFVYTITGAHLVMVLGAMAFVAVAAFRALGGQFTPSQHDAVTAAALYWYVMVGVYAVIWIAVYVQK